LYVQLTNVRNAIDHVAQYDKFQLSEPTHTKWWLPSKLKAIATSGLWTDNTKYFNKCHGIRYQPTLKTYTFKKYIKKILQTNNIPEAIIT
jgi:hypothetical protein